MVSAYIQAEKGVNMKKQKCQGCGKQFFKDEMRKLNMKTCCCVKQVSLCKSCWETFHGKNK